MTSAMSTAVEASRPSGPSCTVANDTATAFLYAAYRSSAGPSVLSVAPLPSLNPERVRQRLHRVLAGVVERSARQCHPAAHRGDVQDPALPGPAHPGQHQLGEPDQAEEVRFELPADVVHRHLLHGPVQAVPGVVDQHPDRPRLRQDRLDSRGHRSVVGDVQRQGADALIGKVLDRLEASRGGVHGAARSVYATARRLESIKDLADQGIRTLALDVTDDASMAAAVEAILAESG